MSEKTTHVILIIQLPGQAPREIPLDKSRYSLGREPDNDIVLPMPNVSRRHASLEKRGETWMYIDKESHNGTLLNGKRISEVVLQDGMQLSIGNTPDKTTTLTFKISIAVGVPATGLTIIRAYEGSDRPMVIGRGNGADIQLPSPSISRRHAVLQPSGDEWVISDLGSTNGTFIDGQRIIKTTRLAPSAMIQVGSFRLVYEGQGKFMLMAASRGLRLDGSKLIWDVGKKNSRKRILETIDISCYPQEFIGLVGGSGAGKSTLMKALNGIQPPTGGEVWVEGELLYENFDAYRSLIGYVPQDDILHKDLSVEQALRYSAHLRLPPDIMEDEIEQRITRVLDQVELSGQRKQTINSLSGGQRKRASIAVELLADPPLFFLDEPTSGLDPGLEKKMMVTLRRLADTGKTIILVTHATANITECDNVAFMSQGRLVYYGPPSDAGKFFEVGSNDFADIYTQINDPDPREAKKKAQSWEERFKQTPFYQKYIAKRLETLPQAQQSTQTNINPARLGTKKVNSFRQFLWLTRRYFDLIIRDRILLTLLMAIMPVMALMLLMIAEPNWMTGDTWDVIRQQLADGLAEGKNSAGYVVAKNAQILMFMTALACVLLGMFAAAYEIVKERTIFQRERMVFLKLFPYLMSKVVLLGAFAAVQCLLFLAVVSLKVEFPSDGVMMPAFLEIYVTMVLGAIAAIMLGLLVSTVAPNNNSVPYIMMIIVFVQIIFAGVLVALPGAAGNISAITLTRWTTEGIGISTNVEYLNSLTTTRFLPDEITKDVTIEVEKPVEDWEPVTITQEYRSFPGCVGPIPVPVVTENEMETFMDEVTETVTVEPDPADVATPFTFEINYTRTVSHLFMDWGMLLGLSVIFGAISLFVMSRKDVTG